jgi:protein tyrosine/serine phosphatase
MEYELVPPLRYGVVNPSVYRGGYPTLRNFRFLSRLRLKTIISLTPEPPTEDLKTFAMTLGAKVVHIKVLRSASDFSDQLKADLVQAVNVSTETSSFTILHRYTRQHKIECHCVA